MTKFPNTPILPITFPKCHMEGKYYVIDEELKYHSTRYNKMRTVPLGYKSDGASFIAEDILSTSWWVHDALCSFGCWDDGTPVTRMEAAYVLYDILRWEGRWYRARTWWLCCGPIATFFYGSKLPKPCSGNKPPSPLDALIEHPDFD